MQKLNQTQIALILIVVALIIGAFTFGLPQKFVKYISQTKTQRQAAQAPLQMSVAGKVSAISLAGNSFTLTSAQGQGGESITVKPGKDTKIVQLVFPFDVSKLPAGKSFTPERKEVSLKDLKVGNQVFVRSGEPIKAGQDVANPIEVQILP